jgi:WD40 repeat protein
MFQVLGILLAARFAVDALGPLMPRCAVHHDHTRRLMQVFDCDLHPHALDTPLLGTGWSSGHVKFFLGMTHAVCDVSNPDSWRCASYLTLFNLEAGRKGGRVKNEDDITYNSWNWELYQSVRGSTDAIFASKFSPKGDQFITTSKDWTVCIYNYPVAGVSWGMGPENLEMHGHFQRVQSSEMTDRKFHLLCRLPGHNAPVLGLAFHPSGGTIATGGADEIGMLWGILPPPEASGDDSQRNKLEMLVRGNVTVGDPSALHEWNSLGKEAQVLHTSDCIFPTYALIFCMHVWALSSCLLRAFEQAFCKDIAIMSLRVLSDRMGCCWRQRVATARSCSGECLGTFRNPRSRITSSSASTSSCVGVKSQVWDLVFMRVCQSCGLEHTRERSILGRRRLECLAFKSRQQTTYAHMHTRMLP